MKNLLIILLAVFISIPFLLGAGKVSIEDVQLSDEALIKEIQKYYPTESIEIFNSSEGRFAAVYHYSTYTFALSTADHSKFKGYKGYSNLIIFVDINGNVKRIVFVDSDDTRPWVNMVLQSDILSELSKQNLNSDERPSYLVTGATVTSTVFNKSINRTLEWFKDMYPYLKIMDSTIIIMDSLNVERNN